MDKTFADFQKQYNHEIIQNYINRFQEKTTTKNHKITTTELLADFSIDFTLNILKDYHDWLLANYDIIPKEN